MKKVSVIDLKSKAPTKSLVSYSFGSGEKVVPIKDVSDGYIALVYQVVDSAKHAAELSILGACASGGVSIGIEIFIEHNN